MAERPSIHDWIGGTEAIRRWLDAFYDEVERDPLLGPVFGGFVTIEHRDLVTAWWAEVMGGPPAYTEKHGGPPGRPGGARRADGVRRVGLAPRRGELRPASEPASHAPVPRWDWGVAPPYEP
ncbi:MAG: globin [Marmoricola sp.]|jgi:hemoglobin|nr:globin [Marmoricola sp.]